MGASNRKLGGLKKGPFDPDDPFTRSCASRRPVFDETLTSGVDGTRQPREHQPVAFWTTERGQVGWQTHQHYKSKVLLLIDAL